MPFTLAHPAAVLWCARWRAAGVPLSAFVIGAMSPDFEYLMRLRTISVYAHTLPGILTFCVPVGLLVCLVFRGLVAAPLRAHLPFYFQRRLPPEPGFDEAIQPRALVLTCAAIAMGAATHIIWDSFTHYHGALVPLLPWLRDDVAGYALHRYLQHGSTLFGFLIIGWWFHRQPAAQATDIHGRRHQFWTVALLSTGVGFGALLAVAPNPDWVTWILCGMNAAAIGLFAGGFWNHLGHKSDLAV